jgi:hypothetical protein
LKALALAAAIPITPALADTPNRSITPGDVLQHDTAAVCSAGNASRHRKVSYRTRDRVYLAYGIPRGRRQGLYEIDHLVPLELGSWRLSPRRRYGRQAGYLRRQMWRRLHQILERFSYAGSV